MPGDGCAALDDLAYAIFREGHECEHCRSAWAAAAEERRAAAYEAARAVGEAGLQDFLRRLGS